MKDEVTVFKVRIDSVKEHAIGFEVFAGNKVEDTYVNILSKGTYGVKNRLVLTPKQFSDFCHRLIAYVYLKDYHGKLNDSQLKVLWDLKLNIFDSEVQQISGSIFDQEKSRLKKLGLLKRSKENDKKGK